MGSDICYVYWIHRESDTDILTQGYVGISVNPESRLKSHIRDMRKYKKSGKNHIFYNALSKYEDFKLDVILCSTRDYCSDIEYTLRPSEKIGLNCIAGGTSSNTSRLSYKYGSTTRDRISAGVLLANQKDPSIIDRSRLSRTGKKRTEQQKKNLSDAAKLVKRNAWDNENANHNLWSKAIEMFNEFSRTPNITYYKLGKLFGFTHSTAQTIHRMFLNGWNPLNDKEYLKYLRK